MTIIGSRKKLPAKQNAAFKPLAQVNQNRREGAFGSSRWDKIVSLTYHLGEKLWNALRSDAAAKTGGATREGEAVLFLPSGHLGTS